MKELSKNIIYQGRELNELLKESLIEIKEMVEKNSYQISDPKILKDYLSYNYMDSILNSSKKIIKKTNRFIRLWSQKGSLENANRLLGFLKSRLTATKESKGVKEKYWTRLEITWVSELKPLKILPSEKEKNIQDKRNEWKKLRDQAEIARINYVKEKGDFYKSKIKTPELELV